MTTAAKPTDPPPIVGAPQVFLSHSSADREFVESMRESLEAAGFRCWVAYRDVAKGDEEIYAGQIMAAIQACPYFVVVLSQSAFASHHVPREVERAVSEGRRIISIRREPVELTGGWEYLLGAVQWIDAFERPAGDVARELVASLKAAPPPWMPRPGVAGLGLALPIILLALAIFLRLQPPWPEPPVVGLFSLVALLAPALGSRLFMPQLSAPTWLKRSLLIAVGCLLAYAILWSTCVYEARPRTADDSTIRPIPKMVGGFLPGDDVDGLIKGPERIVGLTYQGALENAGFDPDLVWKPWTVRVCQAALLLCWLGIFAGAGLGLAATVHIVRRAALTPGSSGSAEARGPRKGVWSA